MHSRKRSYSQNVCTVFAKSGRIPRVKCTTRLSASTLCWSMTMNTHTQTLFRAVHWFTQHPSWTRCVQAEQFPRCNRCTLHDCNIVSHMSLIYLRAVNAGQPCGVCDGPPRGCYACCHPARRRLPPTKQTRSISNQPSLPHYDLPVPSNNSRSTTPWPSG